MYYWWEINTFNTNLRRVQVKLFSLKYLWFTAMLLNFLNECCLVYDWENGQLLSDFCDKLILRWWYLNCCPLDLRLWRLGAVNLELLEFLQYGIQSNKCIKYVCDVKSNLLNHIQNM